MYDDSISICSRPTPSNECVRYGTRQRARLLLTLRACGDVLRPAGHHGTVAGGLELEGPARHAQAAKVGDLKDKPLTAAWHIIQRK